MPAADRRCCETPGEPALGRTFYGVGGWRGLYFLFREEVSDDQKLQAHGQETEDTSFGAYCASGQPLGSVE